MKNIKLVKRSQFDVYKMVQEFMQANPHRKIAETIAYREGMEHIIEMIFGKV